MTMDSVRRRLAGYLWKLARVTVAVVGVLYLVFVVGLAVLNWLASDATGPDDAVRATSKERHEIVVLNDGTLSLYKRLKLIEQARRSIELEFFIYNVDEASRLLTQALVARAQAGVKVRVLVDFSAPVFQLKPAYAEFLRKHGVEVRYYNTSAAYRLVSIQHRSHRKLLIVDGASVITGGRNIGNEYFDLDERYNFLDTDMQISGPIVPHIVKSFDHYWGSSLSLGAESLGADSAAKELEKAKEFLSLRESDKKTMENVFAKGEQLSQASKAHECTDIEFVTDFPNHGASNRRVFEAVARELKSARTEVVAESPYFVIREGGFRELEALANRKVKLKVLTNGLASTDAFYTVASLFLNVDRVAETGLELKGFEGRGKDDRRWGLHSKRAVIDGTTVMVGTYNIDPRSANLNSELVVICRDQPALAQEILADIASRAEHSRLIASSGRYDRWSIIAGAGAGQKFMFFVSLPLARLFDFLL